MGQKFDEIEDDIENRQTVKHRNVNRDHVKMGLDKVKRNNVKCKNVEYEKRLIYNKPQEKRRYMKSK